MPSEGKVKERSLGDQRRMDSKKRKLEEVPQDWIKKRRLNSDLLYSCNVHDCCSTKEWKARRSAVRHVRKAHMVHPPDDQNISENADEKPKGNESHLKEADDDVLESDEHENENSRSIANDECEEEDEIGVEDEDEDRDEDGDEDGDEDEEDEEDAEEDEKDEEDDEDLEDQFFDAHDSFEDFYENPIPDEGWSARNTIEILLQKKKEIQSLFEKPDPTMEAAIWFRKLTLLHQIPASIADEILQNLEKLCLLKNRNLHDIDVIVQKRTVSLGYTKTLISGMKIFYQPVSHTLLTKLIEKRPESQSIFLYWDGFRRFRSKGGTTG